MSGQTVLNIEEVLLVILVLLIAFRLLFHLTSPAVLGGIILVVILVVAVPADLWSRVLTRFEPIIGSFGVLLALLAGLVLMFRSFRP